jgi:hypothetical protein
MILLREIIIAIFMCTWLSLLAIALVGLFNYNIDVNILNN